MAAERESSSRLDSPSHRQHQITKPVTDYDDETSSSGTSSQSDTDDENETQDTAGPASNPTPKPNTKSQPGLTSTLTPNAPALDSPTPSTLTGSTLPPSDGIQTRLASFFSQLAEKRNGNGNVDDDEVIERVVDSDADSGYEDDDDGEGEGRQYIELDLALGVLCEEEPGMEMGGIVVPRGGGEDASGSGSGSESNGEEGKQGDVEPLRVLSSVSGVGGGRSKSAKKKIEELG